MLAHTVFFRTTFHISLITQMSKVSGDELEAMMRAEADCAQCPDPCGADVLSYPASLASKITIDEPLYGTVSSHKWHILVSSGQSFTKWPSHLEKVEDSFIAHISTVLDDLKPRLPAKCRLSAIPRGPANGADPEEEVDIFIFPERVVYRGVRREQVKDLFTQHMLTPSSDDASTDPASPDTSLPTPEPITATWVLICGHKLRDNRCGIVAPILQQQFEEVVSCRDLKDVEVDIVSHIGGHKFAGNIVIMTTNSLGTVWYGRVKPEHVDNIVSSTIIKGEVLKPLLRGKTNDW
jgi:hypothetical protein